MKKLWRHWARALGEKVGETNKDADNVAIFRTPHSLSSSLHLRVHF